MKHILITGVSTGIGEGILLELIRNGYFVFGTVRNPKDARRLQKEINSDLFFPVIADITQNKTVQAAYKVIQKKLASNPLDAVINNAGILIGGPFLHLDIEQYRQVMEVNFFGMVNIMKTFIPLMGNVHKKNPARIINISSVLGHYGLPYISTYTASKFAVEGFSDSVRRELEKLNIKIIVLIPGAVKTRIFAKNATDDYAYAKDSVFEKSGHNMRKQMLRREEQGISAQQVGAQVVRILKSPKPKPRYHITGSPWIEWYWPKYLPDKYLDFILGKMYR
ncbi:MAG: SDR family oxidoreductase [Spirochaetia bacterium]|nr:SDR family oxidoreductase [Spirochaetia bacterium]